MQPLAYLAVRCCLSWLQFLEQTNRGFLCSTNILLTTGPVHCWSVVYALFIAVHLRTYRHIGHSAYEEKLPMWVWWIETLTVLSTVVWWIASCLLAFARIVSDDLFGLPTSRYDAYTPKALRFVLSRSFRDQLGIAHMLSGIGLFVSLLFLSCALPWIPGELVTCEFCLVFITLAYSTLLLVMACRSAMGFPDKGWAEASLLAVVEEAATLGPQLCVLLTLANVPFRADRWERVLYVATTAAWGASVAACGLKPPKCSGMAAPPSILELVVCTAVDLAAAVTLVFCFPPLNSWPMWLLALLLLALGALATYNAVRAPLVEILEPIMPIRNDVGVRMRNPVRDGARGLSRLLALVCSLAIAWDVSYHVRNQVHPAARTDPPTAEYDPSSWRGDDYPELEDSGEHYPDKWSAESRLMMRWKGEGWPGAARALELAAHALGMEAEKLAVEHLFPELRVLLFRFLGPIEHKFPHNSVSERWENFLHSPQGELADHLDNAFPGFLDAGLCLSLPYQHEAINATEGANGGLDPEQMTHVHYVLKSIDGADERLAYAEVCRVWRHGAFPDEDAHMGEYDGPGYDGDMDMYGEHMGHWDEENYMDEEMRAAQEAEGYPPENGGGEEGGQPPLREGEPADDEPPPPPPMDGSAEV